MRILWVKSHLVDILIYNNTWVQWSVWPICTILIGRHNDSRTNKRIFANCRVAFALEKRNWTSFVKILAAVLGIKCQIFLWVVQPTSWWHYPHTVCVCWPSYPDTTRILPWQFCSLLYVLPSLDTSWCIFLGQNFHIPASAYICQPFSLYALFNFIFSMSEKRDENQNLWQRWTIHSYVIFPEGPLQLIIVDCGTAVVGDPEREPVCGPGQLAHSPLSPVLDSVDVDVDVVAPVRPVLDVREPEDVKEFVSSSDVIHSTSSLGYGSQHQDVRTRSLEVSCNDNKDNNVKWWWCCFCYCNYDNQDEWLYLGLEDKSEELVKPSLPVVSVCSWSLLHYLATDKSTWHTLWGFHLYLINTYSIDNMLTKTNWTTSTSKLVNIFCNQQVVWVSRSSENILV